MVKQRDSKDLQEHKRRYPSLLPVPDEEFLYIDGKWMITLKGVRMLAFLYKRPDVLQMVNRAEEAAK